MEKRIYSVSKINSNIHDLFKQEYLFQDIFIKGEVGTLKYWNGGVIYFTLKDENSELSSVMFSNFASKMTFKMETGMEVIVRGSIDVNEKKGVYQLKAREIVKANDVGKAGEMLALLKKELSELGMFDEMYKQPIPKKIKKLGVVTARTGAAITDITKVTRMRNPGIQIILSPATVQGEHAAESVVEAINLIAKTDVDVIIVGRGGGSDEDLWAFNNREIAEAVFNCPIPVISAVGHEKDYTILDLVADKRAATPSQAAEIAVYNLMEAIDTLKNTQSRLSLDMNNILRLKKSEFENRRNSILQRNPLRKIEIHRLRLNGIKEKMPSLMDKKLVEAKHSLKEYEGELPMLMDRKIEKSKHRLGIYIEKLKGLSPLDKLSQGYSYTSVNGKTLNSISMVSEGDEIEVYVKDGIISADVTKKRDSNFK